MLNKTNLLLCFGLCLAIGANSAPHRTKRNTEEEKAAEIKKFHVTSKIQLRYAITDVETQMQNRHSEAKEVFFDIYIPKEAFVSNFTMDIKGKTYQAAVKTKEIAKKIYENSTETSGLLQSFSQPEFTDGKQVCTINNSISINVSVFLCIRVFKDWFSLSRVMHFRSGCSLHSDTVYCILSL